MSEKNDLITYVVPTYNRPKLLGRLLAYAHKHHRTANFVILDSSAAKTKVQNKNLIDAYDCLNICYFDHFHPHDHPFEKLVFGVSNVTTPYCSFWADDDFIYHDGMLKAISFLEDNFDFACCQGFNASVNSLISGGMSSCLTIKPTNSHLGNSCYQRLSGATRFNCNFFYSLYRTSVLKSVFCDLAPILWGNGLCQRNVFEHIFYRLVLFRTKVAAISSFMYLRDSGSLSVWKSNDVRDSPKKRIAPYFRRFLNLINVIFSEFRIACTIYRFGKIILRAADPSEQLTFQCNRPGAFASKLLFKDLYGFNFFTSLGLPLSPYPFIIDAFLAFFLSKNYLRDDSPHLGEPLQANALRLFESKIAQGISDVMN